MISENYGKKNLKKLLLIIVMAKLVSALDSITQTGENGCQEYMWSDDKQEKILAIIISINKNKR